MQDNYSYLEEDFDASQATIPQLVRILSKHDIQLPSSKQKKDHYVSLFNEQIASKRSLLLKQIQSKTPKQPVKGLFASPYAVSNTSRKRSSNAENTSDDAANITPLPIKSSTSKKKSKSRRKSLAKDATDMFSDDNPFQSGIDDSPSEGINVSKKTRTKSRRVMRKIHDTIPATFNQSDEIDVAFTAEGSSVPVFGQVKQSVATPVKSPQRLSEILKQLELESSVKKKPSFTVKPSTPGINRPATQKPVVKNSVTPVSFKPLNPFLFAAKTQLRLFVSIAIAFLTVSYLHWLAFIHPDLQYCSSTGSDVRLYTGYNPLGLVFPSCIQCPDQSICSTRAITHCKSSDYKLVKSAFNFLLGDSTLLFPLGQPACVLDTDRLEKEAHNLRAVKRLTVMMTDIVRRWMGNVECKYKTPEKWVYSATPPYKVLGMPLNEAKKQLRLSSPKSWSESKFNDLWALLLNNINGPRQEGGLDSSSTGDSPLWTILDERTQQNRLVVPSKPPILDIPCSIKQHISRLVFKYALHLTTFCALVIGAMVVYVTRQQQVQEHRIVSQIVEDVLDMVHSESDNHHANPGRYPAPGLAINQVQDHLIPKIFATTTQHIYRDPNSPYMVKNDGAGHTIWLIPDASVRKRIWTRVVGEIAKTSAVRKTTMEIKGQPQDLWMWVASLALSPRKPKVSLPSI